MRISGEHYNKDSGIGKLESSFFSVVPLYFLLRRFYFCRRQQEMMFYAILPALVWSIQFTAAAEPSINHQNHPVRILVWFSVQVVEILVQSYILSYGFAMNIENWFSIGFRASMELRSGHKSILRLSLSTFLTTKFLFTAFFAAVIAFAEPRYC